MGFNREKVTANTADKVDREDRIDVPSISPVAAPRVLSAYEKEARGKTFTLLLSAAVTAQAVNSLSNTLQDVIDNATVVAQGLFSKAFPGEEYRG